MWRKETFEVNRKKEWQYYCMYVTETDRINVSYSQNPVFMETTAENSTTVETGPAENWSGMSPGCATRSTRVQCAVNPVMPSKITTMKVTMETKLYGIPFPENTTIINMKNSEWRDTWRDTEWLRVGVYKTLVIHFSISISFDISMVPNKTLLTP